MKGIYRRFTTEQQAEFTDAFTIHLGNLYLDRLNNDSQFSVLLTQTSAMKPIRKMQRARVNSLINNKTAIDYSLRLKNDENLPNVNSEINVKSK